MKDSDQRNLSLKRAYLTEISKNIVPLANRGKISLFYKKMEKLINRYVKKLYNLKTIKEIDKKLPQKVLKDYYELINFCKDKRRSNSNGSSFFPCDNTPSELLGKVYVFIKYLSSDNQKSN
jgi:hypothetical protein